MATRRSRSGCSSTSPASCATASACRPWASSVCNRPSIATSRSSSRRVRSAVAKPASGRSASTSPRHNSSAAPYSPAATCASKRTASSRSRADGIEYPPRSVASTDAPRLLRSSDTYFCSVLVAVAGGSPSHTSSTSASVRTTSPAASRSRASTARGRGPPRSRISPPRITRSGPRISKVVSTLRAPALCRSTRNYGEFAGTDRSSAPTAFPPSWNPRPPSSRPGREGTEGTGEACRDDGGASMTPTTTPAGGVRVPLQLGDQAPDFTAMTTEGPIWFHDWLGDSWGLLFSHPHDFAPVCTTELGTVARMKPEFDRRDVKVIGLSVDPINAHRRWVEDIAETQGRVVDFPLIADPERIVSKLYGMIHPKAGGAGAVRSLFVIGPDKLVKLTLTYPESTGRNFWEVVRAIDSLQLTTTHRVATPANWQAGEDVIIVPAVADDEARRQFRSGWKAPKPYLRIAPHP